MALPNADSKNITAHCAQFFESQFAHCAQFSACATILVEDLEFPRWQVLPAVSRRYLKVLVTARPASGQTGRKLLTILG